MSAAAPRIACIVEGHAEATAIPVLIRRARPGAVCLPPLRIKRSSIERHGELERAIELQAAKLGGTGGLLMVFDADDDCPSEKAASLLERSRQRRSDLACRVVFASRELEAWFLAGLESLRGCRGIPADAVSPELPETIRGAKERLGRIMRRPYDAVRDAPALMQRIDLDLTRSRARSFDKLIRDLMAL